METQKAFLPQIPCLHLKVR